MDLIVYGNSALVEQKIPVTFTFGNFDGVHRGHQDLLAFAKEMEPTTPLLAMTFSPHPTAVLAPTCIKPLILSAQERARLLLAAGADAVVVCPFTRELANLSADAFVTDLLLREFQISSMVFGYNLSYGRERAGDFPHMKRYALARNFKAVEAKPFLLEGEVVSSTLIRRCLTEENLTRAARLLGRPYFLSGRIVHGEQIGRKMGFPTANLALDVLLLVKPGVYACRVDLEGYEASFPAVLNIGFRPTIIKTPTGQPVLSAAMELRVEAHLLDFNEEIYNLGARYHLVQFLRDEKKFSSLDLLKQQIALDVAAAREIFFN